MTQTPTSKKILVVGSASTDMITTAQHLPKLGETVLGTDFNILPGGKGANQAVAAARSGGHVSFIASLGSDTFADNLIAGFKADGICVEGVSLNQDCQTGVAQIIVDENGDNIIAVYPGANALLSVEMLVKNKKLFESCDIIVLQQEIPAETVEYAINLAAELKKTIILNPAPAREIPLSLYTHIDFFIPNETEAEILTGIAIKSIEDAHKAAEIFLQRGIKNVLITLGHVGVYFMSKNNSKLYPAFKVKAVDTTAAGDTFAGAFSAAFSRNESICDAVFYAEAACALSVQKIGAQNSIPTEVEIKEFLNKQQHNSKIAESQMSC